MYRLLEVGEVIEKGDEYWSNEGWRRYQHEIGNPFVPGNCDHPSRRLVKPDVTPAASSVPDPGEGYRLLKPGELVEKGDEFLHTNGKWIKSHNWQEKHQKQGTQCDIVAYRRKLPAQPAVDPGEGWRLLEPDETIQKDDRYFDSGSWIIPAESVGKTVREAMATWPSVIQAVRRRVGKPAPIVSVGDRVKVLSGPWAGCTGVVTLLDKWNQWNTDVSVLLDHVRVGGERLGLVSPIRDVEKLPPVVPEVLYRDLSHGETVKAGDQFWTFGYGPWADAGPEEIGDTINHYKARHRRPIRLQSPGWRYLDAGETVQDWDQVWCQTDRNWQNLLIMSASKVTNEKLFRRKLPANQGN